jgi:hypothetical protein
MDTERIATATVTLSISESDFLSLYISEGDREPSWDGNVYIHKDKNKKKVGIKKVPIQVKGRSCNDFSKKEITYSVSTDDLNNYLYDGGVIFFVVYIKKNGTERKIYYISLLPIKIRIYLEESKEQGSKSLKLTEFPTDNKEKTLLFLSFYEHSLKQSSFAGGKLPTIDELEEMNVLESISMSVSGYNIDASDPKKALFNNEIYMYANIKGSSIPQPLQMIPLGVHTSEEIKNEVYASGKLFYNNYVLVRSKENESYQFGASFKLDHLTDSSTWKMSFVPTGKLKSRIRDMEFFLQALEAKSFVVNTATFPIVPSEENMKKFDVASQKKTLQYYMLVQSALDLLGVTDELNVDAMKDADWKNIDKLIGAFVYKKPINGLRPDLSPATILEIANLRILLAFIKTEQEGTYNIYDIFKTKLEVCFKDKDGIEHSISQFYNLKKEHYVDLSNINYDAIISSFIEIGNVEQVNLSLLQMICAYDETKNERLYEAAYEISEWLMASNDSDLQYEIKKLNMLQLVRRKREFVVDEIRDLCAMTESGNEREDILFGAYLLLDNQASAAIHFARLDPEQQKIFKQFPIYKFFTQSEENGNR